MATELGTAYVSIVGETSKLEKNIKDALSGGGKAADKAGRDIGERISKTASKALKDGWRPDQDIMAGIPNTKLDRVGARIGQIIGKGVVGGLKAREAGSKFAHSFSEGAGSIGIGRIVSGWRKQLSGGALNSMGMLAGKAFSAGLTAAIGIGVAGAGMALTKGFNRLVTIDTAKYKLKALGKSTEEVSDIVKTVTDAVTGTPFALDQAFATATQAIGAGVKDLQRFMTDVADAAGFAGVSIDRMGLIFNQIQAKGKLTGEEMMQLMEAGLPAKSWIQESYQLTADQFDKMQKDGEITMDMLQKSIEDHAGGMSKSLGDTLQGSIDNLQTSIARLGANFLSAVFGGQGGDDTENMRDAIKRITEYLNQMGNWVNAHRDDIRQFFVSAVDVAKGLVDILGKILGFLKDHPGAIQAVVVAFAAWKTITTISTVATGLQAISTALSAIPGAAAAANTGLLPLLGTVGAVAAAAGGLAYLLHDNPTWGNQGTVGNGGGLLPPLGGFRPGGPFGQERVSAVPSQPGMVAPPSNSAQSILGGLLGTSGGNVTGGGMLGGMPGTAGQGYMNSRAASAYLDAQTFDAALLSRVPSGSYSQTGSADLVQGLGDCTSAIEDLVNLIDGVPTGGRSMATGNAASWLTSRGFVPGTMPGAFNVGFNANHMQATLPGGTPFNWGSQAAAARGGVGGTGAFDPSFTQHFYRPFAGGGSVRGAGSSTSDSIPAMLSNGEHVLAARDVKAMGGQNKVYGFRRALHRARGGAVDRKFMEDMRTAGAIPAAAGSTAKAGESSIAGAIDMGGEFINGMIDQAASAAATAVSAAATAGSFGAGGQAAGPAASFAIGLGANAAKRGVTWGADMLGIGADSLLQQLTPFGQPRWLSQDYTGFVPQQAITGALGDLMSQGAQQAVGATHGGMQGAAPGPIDNLVGSLDDPNRAVHGVGGFPGPGMVSDSATSFLSSELAQQDVTAPNQQPIFKVDNIYTTDAESVGRELTRRGRLAQMQYTGRPGP